MSSMMETLQIRKTTSLPVSHRPAATSVDEEPGFIRRRLSSLSLNLSNQSTSKSVSDMEEQAESSVKEWLEWGWSWICSRKPVYIRDVDLNKDPFVLKIEEV